MIADEATDVANDEQLSISLRFVCNNEPCERFVAFHECMSGVTGSAIAQDILSKLSELQLKTQFLCGQAYDGAGAMAGKSKGASAVILSKYPKALYTHCASHRLNLCIVNSCSIQEVSNMMQSADKISRFFSNSPKRQLHLESWIDSTIPGEQRKKLKELCRTRWVQRHEAFEVFCDLFMPTFCCFESIVHSAASDWNRETRSDAQSYLLAMSQFPFIVALVLTQRVLAYTKGLSVQLQGRYCDVVRAHQEIGTVKTAVSKARSEIDTFHSRVYEQALMISQSIDVDESAPRVARRQQHRSNVPASNTSDYYKRTLTIPLLDHLISELNSRFDTSCSQNLLEFMQLLPSEISKKVSTVGPENFNSILPFDAELHLWQAKWSSSDTKLAAELNTPAKVLPSTDKVFYPNIHILLKILSTLPVTSCECERSISMLRLLKTSLRSTMSEARLNGLAMLQYHRDIPLTAAEVVEEYVRCHPRRLLMANPLTD